MLQTLPEDIFVHISSFLTLNETFTTFTLNNNFVKNEEKYVYNKWGCNKYNIKTYYQILGNVISNIENELDMSIRFPLWRNKRHYRNDETAILMF